MNFVSLLACSVRKKFAWPFLCLCALVPATSAPAGDAIFFENFEDIGFVPIGEFGPAGLIDDGTVDGADLGLLLGNWS